MSSVFFELGVLFVFLSTKSIPITGRISPTILWRGQVGMGQLIFIMFDPPRYNPAMHIYIIYTYVYIYKYMLYVTDIIYI